MVGTVETAPESPRATPSRRPGHRISRAGWLRPTARVIWRPLAILLVARVAMWVVLELIHPLDHAKPFSVKGWDSGWYVIAAQHGWPHFVAARGPSTLEFLPALPTLIRVIHFLLPVTWVDAGYIAALITQILMAVAVWMLARDLWGDSAADRATLLMCFFPGAYVLALIYTEPLIIASGCACLLALRRRRWALAGLAAVVGTITGPNGFALIACCAWEPLLAIWKRREWRSLSATVIAPAGIIAWFAYLGATTGSLTAWSTVSRRGWGEAPSVTAFPHLVERLVNHGTRDVNDLVAVTCTAVAAVLLVVLIRSGVPSVLTVYSVVVLGFSFFSGPTGLHPRFVWVAFPLVMVLGYRLKGEVYAGLLAVSAMLMTALLAITVSSIVLTP